MKIGIIREGKIPIDKRVPLTPKQALLLQQENNIDLVIQSSTIRCFSDEDYLKSGLRVVDNVEDCDVILGVKEVQIEDLVEGSTHYFFSHTIKKQAYNRGLLQAVLEKKIRLIDWETLTNTSGNRLIAF
ncbi:MAG: alanine dehydrogenase, partial [Bacteroidota bacterium]